MITNDRGRLAQSLRPAAAFSAACGKTFNDYLEEWWIVINRERQKDRDILRVKQTVTDGQTSIGRQRYRQRNRQMDRQRERQIDKS